MPAYHIDRCRPLVPQCLSSREIPLSTHASRPIRSTVPSTPIPNYQRHHRYFIALLGYCFAISYIGYGVLVLVRVYIFDENPRTILAHLAFFFCLLSRPASVLRGHLDHRSSSGSNVSHIDIKKISAMLCMQQRQTKMHQRACRPSQTLNHSR